MSFDLGKNAPRLCKRVDVAIAIANRVAENFNCNMLMGDEVRAAKVNAVGRITAAIIDSENLNQL